MSEYAPDKKLIAEVFGLDKLEHPPGELEEKLWTMDLKHLAWFAGGESDLGQKARRILDVRVAQETAESIRKTNRWLVWATWAFVVVTVAFALTA